MNTVDCSLADNAQTSDIREATMLIEDIRGDLNASDFFLSAAKLSAASEMPNARKETGRSEFSG